MSAWARTTYRFDEVSAIGRKSGKCTVCGKRATRQKTFTNTINPWNKNPDGTPRTRAEIQKIVSWQARAWEHEPITHEACKDPT
jgi:hypothetical protein